MNTTIRRVYPATLALSLALTLTGCASTTTNAKLPPEEPAMHSVKEVDDEFVVRKETDPWIGVNKSLYSFNYNLDKYFLLPVVNGYEFVTPTVVQTGVSNFFNNIGEIRTLYNSVFQLKGKKAGTTLSRFLINSTIGVAGLFDPATSFGIKRQNEDFGQTLGHWGAPTGPYLVLPVLGPGTVRSASGFAVDTGIHSAVAHEEGVPDDWENGDTIQAAVTTVKVIDLRHKQPFRYLDSGNPF